MSSAKKLRDAPGLVTCTIANIIVIGVFALFWILHDSFPETFARSIQEDELLEWCTFWAFLGAAVLCLVAAVRQWKLERKEIIDLLNDYFELMAGPIHGHGGQILKFIGDGILAIFPLGDAAFRHYVCRGALEAAANDRW